MKLRLTWNVCACLAILLLAGAGLFGYPVLPFDPLPALVAYAGVLLCGLGLGLILSVVVEFVGGLVFIYLLMRKGKQ